MPYVASHQRSSGDRRYMDCAACREVCPREHRSRRQCGWIPQSEWRGSAPTTPIVPGCDVVPTVCPAYSIALPQVREVARLWAWWDKGQLATLVRRPSETVVRLIEIFQGAVIGSQSYELEQQRARVTSG